jgi:molecular chaperone DnaK
MKGDDKAQIEAKTNSLQQAAQSLYAAASAGHGADAGDSAGAGPQGGAQAEDVVDAEFTEVKDDNQK